MEGKTDEDLKEELFAYLECHDPIKYRKKIKGFNLAFNIRDKNFRIPVEESHKLKMNKKKQSEIDEIKRNTLNLKINRLQ